MGVIRLKNMLFYGYHGVKKSEKELGGKFEVDLELSTSLKNSGLSDDLHDTVEQALIDEANALATKRWNQIKNWGTKRVTQKQLDNWTQELAQIEKWREQVSTTLQRPMDEVNVAAIKARDAFVKLNQKFAEQPAK